MKRRSRIRQEVNKLIWTGAGDHRIVYVDRDPLLGERLRELPVSRVERASEWALYLDDGDTVIPLHRIVEIRDPEGRTVWRRSRGRDTGSE